MNRSRKNPDGDEDAMLIVLRPVESSSTLIGLAGNFLALLTKALRNRNERLLVHRGNRVVE
jgi:hypothetical protein